MGFSFPYPTAALAPAWGEPTTKVNFCEDDYIHVHFVAELINALTSITYVGYGIHGILRTGALFSPAALTYWALIGVGIFSGIFHASLKYSTQMADELSMHVATGLVLHQVFSFRQPPAHRKKVTVCLFGVLVPFFIYHCLADEFLVHSLVFGTMVLMIASKTRTIIRERVPNEDQQKRLAKLASFGTGCASLAYFLWNIDVHLCTHLTAAKQLVGMPWSILLELHGWWHILTAIGAYTFIALVDFLTSVEIRPDHGAGFAWPVAAALEDIGKLRANGKKGSAKKHSNKKGADKKGSVNRRSVKEGKAE